MFKLDNWSIFVRGCHLPSSHNMLCLPPIWSRRGRLLTRVGHDKKSNLIFKKVNSLLHIHFVTPSGLYLQEDIHKRMHSCISVICKDIYGCVFILRLRLFFNRAAELKATLFFRFLSLLWLSHLDLTPAWFIILNWTCDLFPLFITEVQ